MVVCVNLFLLLFRTSVGAIIPHANYYFRKQNNWTFPLPLFPTHSEQIWLFLSIKVVFKQIKPVQLVRFFYSSEQFRRWKNDRNKCCHTSDAFLAFFISEWDKNECALSKCTKSRINCRMGFRWGHFGARIFAVWFITWHSRLSRWYLTLCRAPNRTEFRH